MPDPQKAPDMRPEPGIVAPELEDGEWQPAPRSDEVENASDAEIEAAIQARIAQQDREQREGAIAKLTPKEPQRDDPPGGDAGPDEPVTDEAASDAQTAGGEQEAAPETPGDPLAMREELELQRLRNEKLEGLLKEANFKRDSLAGRLGNLEQTLTRKRLEPEQIVEEERPAAEIPDEDRRELRDELQSLRRERVDSTKRAVVSDFEANVLPAQAARFAKIWGDDAAKDLSGKIVALVNERAPEFAEDLEGTNPKRAKIAAETLLRTALVDAQIGIIEARREAVQRERDEQAAKLKARKLDGDMAGRGRSAPGVKPARAKAPDDLSDAELEAAVQRAVLQEVASRGR